jgi:prepilin-type N-terminal cleavage/methylation domain-containing protein/prepilin-type processing-associated H-X9-DG protein
MGSTGYPDGSGYPSADVFLSRGHDMKTNRAFTLIELLVVIAIIAILLSVLIPALNKIKDAGKRAVCLYNQHALGQAWVLYSEQNDSKFCNAKTAPIVEIPSSGSNRQFRMNWNPAITNPLPYFNEPTWVGWWGSSEDQKKDAAAQQACLTLGTLYPIVDTPKIYRCPVGDRYEWRTYAIVDAMNGHDGFTVAAGYNPPGVVIRKMSELSSPGSRMVFIDEGLATTESWTIYPNIVSWWDAPPMRHGEGTTVAMADGSSDYWKWRDPRTVELILKAREGTVASGDAASYAQNNEDFTRLQMACWGKAVRQ